jgi:hypothetical protein
LAAVPSDGGESERRDGHERGERSLEWTAATQHALENRRSRHANERRQRAEQETRRPHRDALTPMRPFRAHARHDRFRPDERAVLYA